MTATNYNRKISRYRVQIHGCVLSNRDPRKAFAQIDAIITIGPHVRAEFKRLLRKLMSHADNHDVRGNAVLISKIYE